MYELTTERVIYQNNAQDLITVTMTKAQYEELLRCKVAVDNQRQKSLDCYYKRTGKQRKTKRSDIPFPIVM